MLIVIECETSEDTHPVIIKMALTRRDYNYKQKA